MKRLKANTNLTLFTGSSYRGLEVITHRGPLVDQYLDRACSTIQRALDAYPRLLALRFDLRFPDNQAACFHGFHGNLVLQRFVDSLKAKIEYDRTRSARLHGRVHDTVVRYLWAREYGHDGRPHYHFLLLLNRDAYYAAGRLISENENMVSRTQSAWAGALRLQWEQSLGLVHFCRNGVYRVNKGDMEALASLFYRVSYMCKADSKVYADGSHAFGYSRK